MATASTLHRHRYLLAHLCSIMATASPLHRILYLCLVSTT
jgi:hypothetical protein